METHATIPFCIPLLLLSVICLRSLCVVLVASVGALSPYFFKNEFLLEYFDFPGGSV